MSDEPKTIRLKQPATAASAKAIAAVAAAEAGAPVVVEYRTIDGQTAHVTAHETPEHGL